MHIIAAFMGSRGCITLQQQQQQLQHLQQQKRGVAFHTGKHSLAIRISLGPCLVQLLGWELASAVLGCCSDSALSITGTYHSTCLTNPAHAHLRQQALIV